MLLVTGFGSIESAVDQRVDDFRFLNDQPVRRRMEGDEFFIAEGYVSIDRLIESGHRLRSVLLSPSRVERFRPHFAMLAEHDVPVFVAERPVMAEIVGFDLHRGVLASAFRRPLPTVAELATSARRLVVLENLNDGENVGAIARAAPASARRTLSKGSGSAIRPCWLRSRAGPRRRRAGNIRR